MSVPEPAPEPILQFPDPRLRAPCEDVLEAEFGSPRLLQWIHDLTGALKGKGIGIAASQLGILHRIIVIGYTAYDRTGFGWVEEVPFQAIINPKIIWSSDERIKMAERCLSIPGYEGAVSRPTRVRVSGFSPEGLERIIEADSLYARCLQHEIDHLDGILFPDRITDLKDITKIAPVEPGDPILANNGLLSTA